VFAVWILLIGGSMGAVVGEKIARGIDVAIKTTLLVMISKSGGMMVLPLMQ
jgi:acetyl-CoA carboxylase carboxyl transferase subunit beta